MGTVAAPESCHFLCVYARVCLCAERDYHYARYAERSFLVMHSVGRCAAESSERQRGH